MATGRLGAVDISAAANTTVYTVPASTFTVATISICNRGASPATIRIAVASTGTPGAEEYLEYDSSIVSHGVLERTGIVMDAGKLLVVYSSAASISAVVMGIETATA